MLACAFTFLAVALVAVRASYPSPYSGSLLAPALAPGRTSRGEATFDGAVPLGNGDVAVTLWVNATAGTVEFYVRKADAQGAAADEMVIALLRVGLSPNPFLAANGSVAFFNQTLDLATATVTIFAGGSSTEDYAARVSARVDANANVFLLDAATGDATKPLSLSATLASVRGPAREEYPISWACFKGSSDPDVQPATLPAPFADADTLLQFHRNNAATDLNAARLVLEQQNISDLENATHDAWLNRTFGVAVDAGGGARLERTSPSTLISRAPAATVSLRVTVVSTQSPTADEFLAALAAAAAAPPPLAAPHAAWWAAFWARSRVEINVAPGGAPAPAPPNATALLRLSAAALDASATPAGPLARWPDSGGGGFDAVQGASGSQPVFVPGNASAGALPAVLFAAARGTFLTNPDFQLPTGASTIIAVFTDTGSPSTCCSGIFYANASCRGLSTARGANGSEHLLVDWCYSLDARGGLDLRGRRVVAAVVYGASAVPGNTSAASYINGCSQTTDAVLPTAASEGFYVGSRAAINGRFFDGALHELIVYDAALDAASIAAVSGELAARWAVPPLLPGECAPLNAVGFAISQKFAMQRYVSAAQSRSGGNIMRFNGMLFMANRPPLADARTWGTLFCHNNDRIPYISTLATGDSDLHTTFLEYNLARLPLSRARTQRFFGHDGIHFTECKSPIGTPSSKHFDGSCTGSAASRPPGYPASEPCYGSGNAFEYGGDGGTPEIALAALEHFYYTGNTTALARFLPLATLAATFYDLHYARDPAGRLRIFPTGVLEHRWCKWNVSEGAPSSDCCANDLPSVAGITHLLEQLLTVLPANATPPATRASWAALRATLPSLPNATGENGSVTLLDAEQLCSPGTNNVESAPMYAVYPYRRFTVGRALGDWGGGGGAARVAAFLRPATDAFYADPNAFASNTDWTQGVFDAALLGLAVDAARLVTARALTPPAPGYTWPGFAPALHDYAPETELYGGMNAAVAFMLLQPGDDAKGTIALLPAWPCAWAVSFRLWAPLATVIEVDYSPAVGEAPPIRSVRVTPAARAADVQWAGCSG